MDAQLRRGLVAAIGLFGLAGSAGAQPAGGLTEQMLIRNATAQLRAMQADPSLVIPERIVADAQGIAVFPDIVKAGFLVGARVGHGLLVVRLPDGTWSQPIFLTLAGGSIGLQAGVASSDAVFVFRNRQSIERFLLGRGTLALNGDASVAVGPRGNGVGGATNLRLAADVLTYGRNRGFFAGVSGGGSSISIAKRRNFAYYGDLGLDPNAILTSPDLGGTPEVAAFHSALSELEGVPVVGLEPAAQPAPVAPPTSSRRVIRSTPAPKPVYVEPHADALELDPDFGPTSRSTDRLDPPMVGRASPTSGRTFTSPRPYYYDLPAPRPKPVATPIKPPADPAPVVDAPKIDPPKSGEAADGGLPQPPSS